MIRAAIFDMDGTLVNNTLVYYRAFDLFCRRYGVTDWEEKIGRVIGMGNDDIMRALLPAEVIRTHSLSALADEKEAIYREIYAPEIQPVPGLVQMLQKLKEAHVPCAVGSSGCRTNVDFVLQSCHIEEYFSVIISGDRVKQCKPAPEIYLTAADALGVDPSEVVVFEDAAAGFEAAQRAGVGKVVALATTHTREQLAAMPWEVDIIDDFRDAVKLPFLDLVWNL